VSAPRWARARTDPSQACLEEEGEADGWAPPVSGRREGRGERAGLGRKGKRKVGGWAGKEERERESGRWGGEEERLADGPRRRRKGERNGKGTTSFFFFVQKMKENCKNRIKLRKIQKNNLGGSRT